MMHLLPPNASALERAIAATGAGIDTLPVAVRDTWNPATCPAALLPWLAWALAVDEWDEAWSDAVKRTMIADAVELHRHRGTVWSLKKSLAPLGMAVDVIDQAGQRASYAELHALRLDGAWHLDSAMKISPVELYANLPQIQHWAQFIVRANLADAVRAENFTLLHHLVQKWKPARSWPIFMFWLMFVLEIRSQANATQRLDKQITARFPWRGQTIADNARWSLGRDGSMLALPQALGSFHLGEQRGAISTWRLKGSRVESATVMHSSTSANVYRLPALAEIDRRLNGSWRLSARLAGSSSHATITASSSISAPQQVAITHHLEMGIAYPATPARLGARTRLAAWRRLDGRWAVGANTAGCRFGFALRRDHAMPATASTTVASVADAYTSPERLAKRAPIKMAPTLRQLDGSWQPGAEHRIGRFNLDGRRLRQRHFATCPRIGSFAVMQDVPGTDQDSNRRLYLNGRWRIGAFAAPQFNIHIIKEVAHG